MGVVRCAGRPQVHLDAVGGVDARRQVDELLRVGPDLAADVQAAQAVLQGQLGARLQHAPPRSAPLNGTVEVEQVLGIEQVAVARRAQREVRGPGCETGRSATRAASTAKVSARSAKGVNRGAGMAVAPGGGQKENPGGCAVG